MERESATQRCPRCRRTFWVLADEAGSHPCPACGYAPWVDRDDETEEEAES